ncbi:MAG: universal stress protein [Dehalococcoidia bacterium]
MRLLIALDGSRVAEEALAFVAAYFSPGRTEVHLLSVVQASEAKYLSRLIEKSPVASYRRLYLRACAQDLPGFTVRCVIGAHDVPAEAILTYVQLQAIQLLVLTSHGNGWNPGNVGSVAEALISARAVPLLIVPAPFDNGS